MRRLSGTVIKRIKYGAQRISGRISAVMSVNIKYCILRAGAGFKLCCLYCPINLGNAPCETADEDIAMLCLCRCFGLCALSVGKLIGAEGVGRFYGFC